MIGQSGKLVRRWLALALAFMLSVYAPAAMAQTEISASLIAETQRAAPGETTMLAIVMEPKPGWHGYWKNPGEAGQPPEAKWSLPKGAVVGVLRYPVPEKLVVFDLMNHVYEGPHAFLVPLRIARDLPSGTKLPIALDFNYLACSDKVCTPQRAQLSLDLTVGIPGAQTKNFDRWRKALSMPLASPARFARSGDVVRFAIPLPASVAIETPWVFAATQYQLADLAPQKAWRDADMLFIEAKAGAEFDGRRFEGLISIGKGMGFDFVANPGAVAIAGTAIGSVDSGTPWQTIWLAIAGALLGGLLLNIMPCVFPVISLKALSLARAGHDERAARHEALAYSIGVILVCLLLGGAILGLRAVGIQAGWAFQLQDIRVIGLLFLLALVLTACFAGLIHMRGFDGGDALAGQGGVKGAFWTGALAAFVATPCTGPFMATALGAALVLPTAAALGIFAGLGLGLAAPFLLIAYIPALRARLPRPGPWMVRFQQWLAIPMGLTTLALGWLIWRQLGMAGLGLSIVTGAILVFLLARRPAGVPAFQLAAALGLGAVVLGGVSMVLPRVKQGGDIAETAFDEKKLTVLVQAKKPVFLYFTADWCVTCKVNEKVAISEASVVAHFEDKGVTVMQGDWTNGDPAITRYLERFGRTGVPLYLAFTPGKTTPEILPQLLTPTLLRAAYP